MFDIRHFLAEDEEAELDNGGFDRNFVQRQNDFTDSRSVSVNSEDARAAVSALRQGNPGPAARQPPPVDDEDDEESMLDAIKASYTLLSCWAHIKL